MAKIKICGLRRDVDIDYVNELKPDYIGFILTDGFRRSIDVDLAKELKSKLSPDIKAVGVFVDDDIDKINYCLDNGIIDIAQLHGKLGILAAYHIIIRGEGGNLSVNAVTLTERIYVRHEKS